MTTAHGGVIKVLLAVLPERPRNIVGAVLMEENDAVPGTTQGKPSFECIDVAGRGMRIVEHTIGADVVVFGLTDGVLPGEASHLVALFPDVKIVGVDHQGHGRMILGAVDEPLSSDLPTVLRWITRRDGGQRSTDRPARGSSPNDRE